MEKKQQVDPKKLTGSALTDWIYEEMRIENETELIPIIKDMIASFPERKEEIETCLKTAEKKYNEYVKKHNAAVKKQNEENGYTTLRDAMKDMKKQKRQGT